MTECEVFEMYGQSLGWDLTRDENGNYSQPVSDYFRGWLARADIQKAVEIKNMQDAFNTVLQQPNRGFQDGYE